MPAFSEMEIMVNTIDKVTEGTWVVEGFRTPKSSGDGTAMATAAMAAPRFTVEINNSLVIVTLISGRRSITTYCVNLRQLLALLFKQDGCKF